MQPLTSGIPRAVVFSAVLYLIPLSCMDPSLRYPRLDNRTPVALVSYALDRSIVLEGEERDDGEGGLVDRHLLKEDYYRFHRVAVQRCFEEFAKRIDTIFDVPFVPLDTIRTTPAYRRLTAREKKMVLGTDITPGKRWLSPGGFNYVGEHERETLDSLAGLWNAGALMLVELRAGYQPRAPHIDSSTAMMKLAATITLVAPGEGRIWSWTYWSHSRESARLAGRAMDPANFERLLVSAQEGVFPQLAQDVRRGREVRKESGDAGP